MAIREAEPFSATTSATIEAPVRDTPDLGSPQFREVGRSISRLEGHAKVNGSVEYIHNLRLPGMLYGRIHRSTVAHARIVRIDTSAALAVEGVHAVVTGEDVLRLSANRLRLRSQTIRTWPSRPLISWSLNTRRSRQCSTKWRRLHPERR
jgi:CO/xanthine dehydrogenase Mo-binding subunit